MEARVFGFVNDTHTSATELLDNPVVRDSLAEWSWGIRHLGRY
jgi:hypothetical protein